MPRVLNVEKLQKKFATLTRSRDSIQSLSAWIMHHSEFHEDIVNQWLIGLSKDYSALVMFYVANDVIQNCGKKRVPEFREDFYKVLERAVSLEKVKEIKKEVMRLLNFWKERDIYDGEFSLKLQNILNSQEVKVPSEDEETSELEIIARFKQENFIDNLKKLKTAADERIEKEEILNYAEEPEMPELDDLIVRKECQDMLNKCDIFLKLVEESIDLTNKELNLRKQVLKDLKDCCVFYTAQNRDVKEVANMFRIYGRKLKIMEKKVAEKKTTLPTPGFVSSPCFSDKSAYSPVHSISSNVTPSDHDDSTNVFKSSQRKVPISSCTQAIKPDLETGNKETGKSFFELLSKGKSAEEINKNIPTQSLDTSEQAKLKDETLKTIQSEQKKSNPLSSVTTQNVVVETLDKSINDSKNEQTKDSVHPQLSISDQCTQKIAKHQEDVLNQQIDASNQGRENISIIPTKSPIEESIQSNSNQKSNTASSVSEGDDIDFLLDESYDCKKGKPKLDMKRKIQMLLNSREKRQKTDANSEMDVSKPTLDSEMDVSKPTLDSEMDVSKPTLDYEMNDLKSTEKSLTEKEKCIKVEEMDTSKEDTSEKLDTNAETSTDLYKTEKLVSETPVLKDEEKTVDKTGDPLLKSPISKENDCVNINENSEEGIFPPTAVSIQENPSEASTLINTNATFTGADLGSYFSNISTELLKNILEKNKSEPLFSSVKDSDNTSESSLHNTPDNSQTSLQNSDSKPSRLDNDPVQDREISKCENIPLLTDVTHNSELSSEKTVVVEKEPSSPETKSFPSPDSLLSTSDKEVLIKSTVLPTSSPDPQKIEELSNHKETIPQVETVKSLSSDKVTNDEKPNLLNTLHSVLECISKKKVPSTSFNVTERLGSVMPFENCLRIYSALCYSEASFSENISKSASFGSDTLNDNSLSKGREGTASIINLGDNFEVMDMECDTDEENL